MLHCRYSVLEQRSAGGILMMIAVFLEGPEPVVMLLVFLALAGGAGNIVVLSR